MNILGKLVVLFLPYSTAAGILYSSSFSSSNLSPFSACNVKAPSSATASDGELVMYFDETDYDGTRNDRGVEICVFQSGTSTNVVQMHKQGWQGFNLYVPSGDFPTDKGTIISQQFCGGGCSSWCGTLSIEGNSLQVDHRTGCVDPTTATLVSNIARDTWHDVVVHMKVSREESGTYEVWWNGNLIYSKKNINVGFGTWDGDMLTSGWYFKNGMYCYGRFSRQTVTMQYSRETNQKFR